jgi:hypothetical protein
MTTEKEMPKEIFEFPDSYRAPDVIYAMDGHFSVAEGVMVGLFSNQKPINYIGRTEYIRRDIAPDHIADAGKMVAQDDVREASLAYGAIIGAHLAVNASEKEYEAYLKILRAAQQQPEVVTVGDLEQIIFARLTGNRRQSKNIVRCLIEAFPNGVKVVG